jgi:hypothetical protein
MIKWYRRQREQLTNFYQRHQRYWPVVFFNCGFLFDLTMLNRIDSWEVIGQQFAYLVFIGLMLGQMLKEEQSPIDMATIGKFKRFYYHHRLELMHFFIGTLLNAYMIFYFKSSSLMTSFAFLLFLVVLLIVNELPRFRSQGLAVKFGLLALCVYSFCSYVLPVFAGYMSSTLFFLSLLIGYTPFVLAGRFVQKRSQISFELMKSNVLIPSTAVLFAFLMAYWLRIIPPAPLSMPFLGVYHSVDHTSNGYKLGHENAWWKFWNNGDQEFSAQPGDKIYVFFRLFSPTHFSDQVMVTWLHKDALHGWREEDHIPIKIVGGRKEGFRGFGYKANYEPGKWRVQVETMDGREIGRVYFDLELASTKPRNFEYSTQ